MSHRRLTLAKWGNGYGVRLPLALLSHLKARAGDQFEVEVSAGTLVMRRAEGPCMLLDEQEAEALSASDVQRGLQNVINEVERLAVLLEQRG
jgi:antitoxin component of MazEF toxin-antitoxin module